MMIPRAREHRERKSFFLAPAAPQRLSAASHPQRQPLQGRPALRARFGDRGL